MSDPTAGLVTILRRTLPWIRLLSLAGFIAIGFLALLGGMSWATIASTGKGQIPVQSLVTYPVLMLFAFLPAWFLHKCVRRIKVFVAQGHIVQLEAVLEAQRTVWKFGGVLALVTAAAAIAAMLIGVLAAL